MKSSRNLKFQYHRHRFKTKRAGLKPLSFFRFKLQYVCEKPLTLQEILADRFDFFAPWPIALGVTWREPAHEDISTIPEELDFFSDLLKKVSQISPLLLKLYRCGVECCAQEKRRFFSELTKKWFKDFFRGLLGPPTFILRTSPEKIKVLLGSYIL